MRLQLLQQVVHRKLGVAVVEPDDHPERDHVVAHRVDEGAAELAVLRTGAERPAERVNHPPERLRYPPDLLDAERPHLRVLPAEAEALDRCAREVALRALGEDSDPGEDVRARLEVRQLLAVAAAPLVAGSDASYAAVIDEQLRRGRLRENNRARIFGLFRQPAPALPQPRRTDAGVADRLR